MFDMIIFYVGAIIIIALFSVLFFFTYLTSLASVLLTLYPLETILSLIVVIFAFSWLRRFLGK